LSPFSRHGTDEERGGEDYPWRESSADTVLSSVALRGLERNVIESLGTNCGLEGVCADEGESADREYWGVAPDMPEHADLGGRTRAASE
jgi:hypothetical protein